MPIVRSCSPDIAILSHASNIPQKDTGNPLGPGITSPGFVGGEEAPLVSTLEWHFDWSHLRGSFDQQRAELHPQGPST